MSLLPQFLARLPEISVQYRSRGDKMMAFHDSPTDIPDPEVVPKAKRRKDSHCLGACLG